METRLKRTARAMLPPRAYRAVQEVVFGHRITELERRVDGVSALLARHLFDGATGRPPCFHSRLNEYELKVFSQNGEDGVLLRLFSDIGTTDRRFVEFGSNDGIECNTHNLSVQWGWSGLLLEADHQLVATARRFYTRELEAEVSRVKIRQAFVQPRNIDRLITEAGLTDEIDLLSIDIDSNDYWVWQAITAVRPRVVVVEYNASFGPSWSATMPFTEHFDRFDTHRSGYYFGASLGALAALGSSKGYRLIGCESRGVNAFFLRDDIADDRYPELKPEEAWYPEARRLAEMPQAAQLEILQQFPVVEV
jgi:hypothetical protein